ncbi:hypothetical protein HYY74_03480 [Candidatus Woesearchaeota archaeon]|nr:hypothetical protein [Candidatus Woesearchaeota archaeon]
MKWQIKFKKQRAGNSNGWTRCGALATPDGASPGSPTLLPAHRINKPNCASMKKPALYKKAAFFTITAAILLLALAVTISYQTKYRPTDRAVSDARISTLNEFTKTVKDDMERGLYISSFRAIMSMEEFITTKGTLLNDSKLSFREAVTIGTISNQSMSLMQQSTFPDWVARINSKATETGLIANFSVNSLEISHKNPWTLLIESNISANITDNIGTASFIFNETIKAEISITGLEDPTFSSHTQGKIIRTVNGTTYEGNYASGTDTTNLRKHIDGNYYANSTSAPSFLMRLEGNYNSSAYGIESFVSVPDLQQKGITQYKRSMIDYVYFGNLSTSGLYKINNTYEPWLIIDEAHLDKYQVRSIASQMG